jgi:hypothetical protein
MVGQTNVRMVAPRGEKMLWGTTIGGMVIGGQMIGGWTIEGWTIGRLTTGGLMSEEFPPLESLQAREQCKREINQDFSYCPRNGDEDKRRGHGVNPDVQVQREGMVLGMENGTTQTQCI